MYQVWMVGHIGSLPVNAEPQTRQIKTGYALHFASADAWVDSEKLIFSKYSYAAIYITVWSELYQASIFQFTGLWSKFHDITISPYFSIHNIITIPKISQHCKGTVSPWLHSTSENVALNNTSVSFKLKILVFLAQLRDLYIPLSCTSHALYLSESHCILYKLYSFSAFDLH